MAAEISIRFDPSNEFQFMLRDDEIAQPQGAGQWLDAQFVELGAEPLRVSGKVLTADKVLAVARAAGPHRFADQAWGRRFAVNALGALARSAVRVDVEAMTLTF